MFCYKKKAIQQGEERNHEALFLPVLIGCSGRRIGHILVAGDVGEMGNYYRGRDSGCYEPFLPDVLLPQPEKNRNGSQIGLRPQ